MGHSVSLLGRMPPQSGYGGSAMNDDENDDIACWLRRNAHQEHFLADLPRPSTTKVYDAVERGYRAFIIS